MTQSLSKEYIIDRMVKQGYRANDIDKALNAYGYDNYNPLTNPSNYQNILPNIFNNAKDMARGFRTLTGQAIRPIQDIIDTPVRQLPDKLRESFMNAVNNPTVKNVAKGAGIGGVAGSVIPGLGTVGGAITGGIIGGVGPKAFSNAMLDPYHVSVDDIKKGQVDPRDIAQGVFENPLYAGLDIASLGGAKVLKGAINKIDTADRPTLLRQIAPSKQDRQVQRYITDNIVNNRTQASSMYKGYNVLDSMPLANREQIARFIISNQGDLTKKERTIARVIRKNLRQGEREAIDFGYLNPSESKNNTVAQYVMSQLGDRYPTLLHDDIMKYINNANSSTRQRKLDIFKGTDNAQLLKDLDRYIKEGNNLYNKDKIAYLTQAIVSSEDPLGIVKAKELNKGAKGYFENRRIIGRSTAKDIAPKLDKSIKYQLDQINTALEVDKTVNDFLKNEMFATEVVRDAEDIADAGEGIIRLKDLDTSKYNIIDPDLLSKNVKDAFRTGNAKDIHKAISQSIVQGQGGYAIDKMYLKALENALKPSSHSSGRKLLNMFKRAVLANPHWIILNRIGNFTNNMMGGVSIRDYADALSTYKDLLPQRLAQQTSFNSYINAIGSRTGKGAIGISLGESFKQPINRAIRSIKEFGSSSSKDLGQYGKLAGDIISSTGDITAAPIFKIESSLETIDRYASFIRQAKRKARETGESVEKILKDSGKFTDEGKTLFNELNTEVNKILGDYLGKNYMIPSEMYQTLSDTIPFYRFLTQTGRTTAHQLANNPLGFQAMVMAPSKVGNTISEEIINTFELDPEQYEGGYPYKAVRDKSGKLSNLRTIGIEPLPIASALTNPSLASPLLTIGGDVLNFQRMGRQASTPVKTILKEMGRKDLADKYKPSGSERMQNARDILLSTFYNPYRLGTTYGPELTTAISRGFQLGEGNTGLDQWARLHGLDKGLQSRYNAVPLSDIMLQNPESYMRWYPSELIGKWFGLQTMSNYPYRESKINPRKRNRNAMYQKEKERQAIQR